MPFVLSLPEMVMANWAWPHTPASNCARLVLAGGPFDGEQAGFLPPDLTAPAQIVWSGWFPWGPAAYLYEWRGERATDHGRTDALIYRPPVRRVATFRAYRGRRLFADEIPPLLAEDAEALAIRLLIDGELLIELPSENGGSS